MDLKFDAKAKFTMEKLKLKKKSEIDGHLINYSRFVKTGPLDSKFSTDTKFNMENSKIKEFQYPHA